MMDKRGGSRGKDEHIAQNRWKKREMTGTFFRGVKGRTIYIRRVGGVEGSIRAKFYYVFGRPQNALLLPPYGQLNRKEEEERGAIGDEDVTFYYQAR